MSNKIPFTFRLFESQNPRPGWSSGEHPYGEGDLDKILDPSGAIANHEITSIPSPFARMHIYDHAFRQIAGAAERDINALEGETIFHKLVSEALDVGEILFNEHFFNKQAKIELHKWNIAQEIETMERSSDQHQLVRDTLVLYMAGEEDESFSYIENIWMVEYDHQLVGGTSPYTLFFAASEDLRHINLRQGDHQFFVDDYCPLQRRNREFQVALYLLFKRRSELRKSMPHFYNYLLRSQDALKQLDKEGYNEVTYSLQNADEALERFEQSRVDIYSKNNNQIFLLQRSESSLDNIDSDFIIGNYGGPGKNTRTQATRKPMVLQSGYEKRLRYFNNFWQPGTKVPSYVEEQNLTERQLPGGLPDRYPWLTVSDFLTPSLIELRFPFNSQRFVTGELINFESYGDGADMGFLPPLQPLFFEYFTVEDLSRKIGNNPVFSLEKGRNGEVRVILRVPIAKDGEYITLERIYYRDVDPDLHNNAGAIEKLAFNLGFIPFLSQGLFDEQRLMLIDAADGQDVELKFFFGNQERFVESIQRSYKDNRGSAATKFYIPKGRVDFIEVASGRHKGLVIPKYPPGIARQGGGYDIAIDFGTTNTHVELKSSGSTANISEPLKCDHTDFLVDLSMPGSTSINPLLQELFLYHGVPDKIGPDTPFDLPFRTVVSETVIGSYDQVQALAHLNIPFYFQKKKHPANDVLTTNIKWSNISNTQQGHGKARVSTFIETLLCIIRNKVLVEGGDPTQCSLTWFYPSSMDRGQRGAFELIWKRAASHYLGIPDNKIQAFSESIAPYYKSEEEGVVSSRYPVINIDIGGETVDIVAMLGGEPQFLTSAKFAGNAVFGDGFDRTRGQNNGIVQFFLPRVREVLERNDLRDLLEVLAQLHNPKRFNSPDLMAFFLSLDRNPELKKKASRYSFADTLKSTMEFKIIYLIFYGAIIYHLAKILKQLGLDMPANIGLSGNGSKIIDLLTTDQRSLRQLTMRIIEAVYEKKYDQNNDLRIVPNPNPKQATCKGGIILMNRNLQTDDHKLSFDRVVLLGDKENRTINEDGERFDRQITQYKELDNTVESSVISEVKEFLKLLFSINDSLSFRNFGIRADELDEYRQIMEYRMDDSLTKGLQTRMQTASSGEPISETLFFYPLIGGLYRLGRHKAGLDYH